MRYTGPARLLPLNIEKAVIVIANSVKRMQRFHYTGALGPSATQSSRHCYHCQFSSLDRVTADRNSEAFDERTLVIQHAYVDEGPTMKRFRPRAQGRAFRVRKRTSHITVVVTAPEDGAPVRKAAARKTTATKATATKAAKSTAKAPARKATAKKERNS